MRTMNLVRGKVFALAAVLALATLPVVKAAPVTWLANGFTFSDGSTIAGGATYDSSSNTYSNNLILATGGLAYNNVFFAYQNPSLPVSPSYITLVNGLPSSDLTNVPSIWIIPTSPLTGPAGSIVPSLFAIEALCADATCSTVQDPTVAFSLNGELVAFPAPTAVPEPAAALMLPGAFLLLAGWKTVQRRRDRNRG
jgi:hypothetical protein